MRPRIAIGGLLTENVLPISDDPKQKPLVFCYVHEHTNDNSPRVHIGGGRTERRNAWYPEYHEFKEFLVWSGMGSFFFVKDDQLLLNRGKAMLLTKEHVAVMTQKLDEYVQRHPDCIGNTSSRLRRDRYYQRLAWFVWWADWSVRNAVNPCIILH